MTEPRDLPGLDALARIVDPVAQRFSEAGHRLYLVGGVVRDLMLADLSAQAGAGTGEGDGASEEAFDSSANDIDLTTDALPKEAKRLLSPMAEAIWSQGERFGTIGARIDGHAIEVTTHRAEAYDSESRKPMVTFGRELGEDLSRRDFTINAAAIELPSLELHDPFDGVTDLAAGVLRTPLSPDVSFTDDPLRMMRAARFIARFSLTPAPELVEAARSLADRLSIVSVERAADEFERLLHVVDAAPGFDFLESTGLLSQLVPQFSDEAASPAQRALAAELGGSAATPMVRRAGTFWPIRDNAAEALSHLRYSRAGAAATSKLLDGAARGLSLAAGVEEVGSDVPSAPVNDRGTERSADRSTVRGIASKVGAESLDSVLELATIIAASDPSVSRSQAEGFASVVAELRADEDLADLDSPLSGEQIMAILNVEPGPEVGKAQKQLRNHRLNIGPMTADEAREVLLSWWRQERGGGHSLR